MKHSSAVWLFVADRSRIVLLEIWNFLWNGQAEKDLEMLMKGLRLVCPDGVASRISSCNISFGGASRALSLAVIFLRKWISRKLAMFSDLFQKWQSIRFLDTVALFFGSDWRMLITRIDWGRWARSARQLKYYVKSFHVRATCIGLPETTRAIIGHRKHQRVIQKNTIFHLTWFYHALPALGTHRVRSNKASLMSALIIVAVLPFLRCKAVNLIASAPFLTGLSSNIRIFGLLNRLEQLR